MLISLSSTLSASKLNNYAKNIYARRNLRDLALRENNAENAGISARYAANDGYRT